MSERAGRGPGPRGGRGAQIGDDGKAGGAGVKSKRRGQETVRQVGRRRLLVS